MTGILLERVTKTLNDVTLDDVWQGFKKLFLQYHPDRNKNPESLERMKQLNEANERLKTYIEQRDKKRY
ncbi:hypothetical protein AGMMS50222_09660 [Endomicrobiia bacterium]|nr:hypothetical protein AGMMS49556_07250 [Endomicrobiia bacterium]GHT71897.1 hypothetical protein AGMMS49950_09440 [Endomicrobiia bacterium]GHT76713.1 hypothetical protein AGMMS50222_09660 [Endomicrobiia bacterium]